MSDATLPIDEKDTATALAAQFLDVARRSKSEEDVKIGIEMALRPALDVLGIGTTGRYEVTLLNGAADAIYGHVVIEYEKPGKIRSKAGLEETSAQLRQYLYSIAQEESPRTPEDALRRMIGISIDGSSILFCQYRTATADIGRLPGTQISLLPTEHLVEGFDVRGPHPVTPESVALMLSCLRAMSRPPLNAHALTSEFGPDGDIARSVVPVLYEAVQNSQSDQVQMFFNEWKRLFGIVYGEDLRHTTKRAKEVGALYGLSTEEPDLLRLLFAIHTYFALLMKLIAVELVALQRGALVEPFVRGLPALPDGPFQTELARLESGDLFSQYGIANFVEGDFFQWYLNCFDGELASGIRALVRKLDEFEPTAATMEPEKAEDLLKELYQALIPRALRHDLGEYYTPDWLAEYVVEKAGYDGEPGARVLDPSCGSGTFLVHFIRMLRRRCLEEHRDLAETARLVLDSITGFDINPLAVIAARTNYLLALGDLVRHVPTLDIPVYFADSILTPAKLAQVFTTGALQPEKLGEVYRYRTVVGEFPIPREVVEARKMEACAVLIEQSLRTGYDPEAFADRALRELQASEASRAALEALFEKISELEAAGLNGIWARILRNSVAPLAVGRYDYVIGNPPWIQWEDLAPDYRTATADLWSSYGLVPSAGGEQYELGKSKRDMSMLFSYACSDSYLKRGGTLAFLITQTVFQTATGEVFRRFALPSGSGLQLQGVDDLVDIKPFDAQNWSAAFVWKEGAPTAYPVEYRLWRRLPGLRVRRSDSLERVLANTERIELVAEPLHSDRRESPWLLAKHGAHASLRQVQGHSPYRGSAGLVTWADGVYWLNVKEERNDGKVIVENLYDAGKLTVPHVTEAIEPDLLMPFVPWAAIERWSATPTHSILMPHTVEGGYLPIPEDEMRRRYPATLAYLYRFKDLLEGRSGYRQLRQGQPFYILGNSGTDFRAPFKVIWRSMGTEVRAAILKYREWYGHQAPEVHKNTVSFVPLHDEAEALYLCGMLNSSYITTYALGSSVRGGKSFAGTGLLNSVAVPKYDASSPEHDAVARLAEAAISNPPSEDSDTLDAAAAAVWGFSERTLDSLRDSRDAFAKAAIPEIAVPADTQIPIA